MLVYWFLSKLNYLFLYVTFRSVAHTEKYLDPTCVAWGVFLMFLLFIYLFNIFFIAVQLQLSAFSPHPSTPPQPNPPPSPTTTLPLDFFHVSFIVAAINPSPHYSFPHSPLAIVRLLLTAMSLVIFCFCFFLLLIMFQLKVRSYGAWC